tara:strand:+ start:85 stop:753 length:669 start_codon:yes stop_codon:yes gene_type:complete
MNDTETIIPIFSTILHPRELVVTEKQTNDLMNLTQTIEWISKKEPDIRSKSIYLIKEHKELHWLGESIFDCFNNFKNNILKYNDTNFVMTTSWLTYTPSGSSSIFHNHTNTMWSGVFYFGNEEGINTGITFSSFGNMMNGFNVVPTEYNDWNCSSYDWHPKNNSVLFFPSQTPHSVIKNTSKQNRYSIAFNLMPSQFCGTGDSSIYYCTKDNDYYVEDNERI